jgi:hypothetical protein
MGLAGYAAGVFQNPGCSQANPFIWLFLLAKLEPRFSEVIVLKCPTPALILLLADNVDRSG